MSQDPQVSVIIAAYNAEGQLGRALDSVFAQTDIRLQVVVADDASRDNTALVAQTRHPGRVTVVRLGENGGPSAARNAAIAVAAGRWLAVLDADDVMAPRRLSSLVALAERHEADLIADNLVVETPRGQRLFIEETLDGSLERIGLADYALQNRLFAKGRGYGYLKPVFRRDFLEARGLSYDPGLRIGEDFLLVAEMLARGAVYLRHRSADYHYSVHDQSISHRLRASEADAMAMGDRRLLQRVGSHFSRDERIALGRHLRSLEDGAAYLHVLEALKTGKWPQAVRTALRRPSALRHLHMPLMVRARAVLSGSAP